MADAPFDFEVKITFRGQQATAVGFFTDRDVKDGEDAAIDIDTVTLADGSEIYPDDMEDAEFFEAGVLIYVAYEEQKAEERANG